MTVPRRLLLHAWIVTLLISLGFVVGINLGRIKQVEHLSYSTMSAPPVDPASPTGYLGGLRMLIAPGHNSESYQWIAQTQQMIASREWRLRQVDYDNAPTGRQVTSPSAYRWWLAGVAWIDHTFSGRPIGLSVEKAALWADPLLLMILLTGGTILMARRFGAVSALFFPLAVATMYPFGGAFLPGCPDDAGLTLLLMAACASTLLAGILLAGTTARHPRSWFIASGIAGGFGLWVSVGTFVPVLISLAVGALAGNWFTRRDPGAVALPWRTWSIAGAVTTFIAWIIEYAPAHLDLGAWRITEVHPLYAVAWLGGGELLARSFAWMRGDRMAPQRVDLIWLVLAGLALLSVPTTMLLKGTAGFLMADVFALRLTALGESNEASNFAKWIVHESSSLELIGVLAPLLFAVPAGIAFVRRNTTARHRLALCVAFVPVVVAAILACTQISWWNQFDLLALLLLLASAAGFVATERIDYKLWIRLAGAAAVILPGLILLWPRTEASSPRAAKQELQTLAEREFAQWLARRTGENGAIVLAPPTLTVSLFYHGGLRGLGSPYRENEDGFRASVRLAGAAHSDEAQALARQRNITHIVMPSWDNFLDEYARLSGNELNRTLLGLLHSWLPPRWLRPVPYYLPSLDQFANEQVLVFEVTDVQDNATSLSRLTEYFVDMGQIDLAAQAAHALEQEYVAELGAQIAKARTEIVRRDRTGFDKSLQAITTALKEGSDDSLAWDRRVSLCLVLATADRMPQAQAQVRRCLDEMNETELRTLSEVTLFQFLSLAKKLGLQIEDPALRELAASLLPQPLKTQL